MTWWAVNKSSPKGLLYKPKLQAIPPSCSCLTSPYAPGDLPGEDYLPSKESGVKGFEPTSMRIKTHSTLTLAHHLHPSIETLNNSHLHLSFETQNHNHLRPSKAQDHTRTSLIEKPNFLSKTLNRAYTPTPSIPSPNPRRYHPQSKLPMHPPKSRQMRLLRRMPSLSSSNTFVSIKRAKKFRNSFSVMRIKIMICERTCCDRGPSANTQSIEVVCADLCSSSVPTYVDFVLYDDSCMPKKISVEI
ncbi:hypothetical protein E2542_SST15414 [Spatholobus suberectus]|nr:hypothetical protein E2542_SST15414 [Spatholobus suberectus]